MLTCSAEEAVPSDITYTWTYPSSGKSTGNKLVVDNAKTTDAGSYHCTAENTIDSCKDGAVTNGITGSVTVNVMCEFHFIYSEVFLLEN